MPSNASATGGGAGGGAGAGAPIDAAAKLKAKTECRIPTTAGVTLVVGTNNAHKTLLLERICFVRRLIQDADGKSGTTAPFQLAFPSDHTCALNSATVQDSTLAPSMCVASPLDGTAATYRTDTDSFITVTIPQKDIHDNNKGTEKRSKYWDDDSASRLDMLKDSRHASHTEYHRKVGFATRPQDKTHWHAFVKTHDGTLQRDFAYIFPDCELYFRNGGYGPGGPIRSGFEVKKGGVDYGLQQMGLGVRNCVAVLAFLHDHMLNYDTKVLCIDEPAVYLHPPQAQRLGHVLARRARAAARRFIVSSHSLPLTRGLLEQSHKQHSVDIVRLSGGHMWSSNAEETRELAGNGYTVRTAVLEGLAHEHVVITENPKDALIFDRAMEAWFPDIQVHFVGSGGKSESRFLAQHIRKLGVHAFVLADIDGLGSARADNPWDDSRATNNVNKKTFASDMTSLAELYAYLGGTKAKFGAAIDKLLDAATGDTAIAQVNQGLTVALKHNLLFIPFGELEVLLYRPLKQYQRTVDATFDLGKCLDDLKDWEGGDALKLMFPELHATIQYVHDALLQGLQGKGVALKLEHCAAMHTGWSSGITSDATFTNLHDTLRGLLCQAATCQGKCTLLQQMSEQAADWKRATAAATPQAQRCYVYVSRFAGKVGVLHEQCCRACKGSTVPPLAKALSPPAPTTLDRWISDFKTKKNNHTAMRALRHLEKLLSGAPTKALRDLAQSVIDLHDNIEAVNG